jgi:hypothetical protein
MLALHLEVERTFLLQKSEIAENILFHFLRLRLRINLLQLGNDLLNGVFAVAALDNFKTGTVQAQRALWHQQDALLIIFSETATGSEARAAVQFGRHRISSGVLCGLEGARWWPTGIHISKVERVELSPEDVAFGAKGNVSQILLFTSLRLFDDPGEREVSVLWRLCEAASEIVEAAREPGIVFAQAIHPQDNQFFREELGEGRSNGFEK